MKTAFNTVFSLKSINFYPFTGHPIAFVKVISGFFLFSRVCINYFTYFTFTDFTDEAKNYIEMNC